MKFNLAKRPVAQPRKCLRVCGRGDRETLYNKGKGGVMNSLTPEQVLLVASSPNQTLRLTDPQTHQTYVLLKEEDFTRLKNSSGLDDEISTAQTGLLMEHALREEDAGDPLLEGYQNYS